MTVAPLKLVEGASVVLSPHCNEAVQNQYNGKNARVGKADGFLKKYGRNRRNRTVRYIFVFFLSS